MTQIQELIKHLGLGIVSVFLFTNIIMADIKNTKDFMKAVEEVRQEYPEDAIERKIPTSFITTVAAAETGNFQFKDAPTAQNANNYFGMKPVGDQKFLTTTGGVNIASFDDPKASVRAFINLITTDGRYKSVKESTDKIQAMFKGMSPYAEREDYTDFLANVYNDRIKPIVETQNMLIPKAKPLNQQMDNLQ